MARRQNAAQTVTITVSTTPQVRDLLDRIAREGLWGKNAAEVAERIIAERLFELRGGEAALARALQHDAPDGGQ